MINLVKLQQDWALKLLSEPALARINVVQLRQMVVESRIDVRLITRTARNGRSGCGIIVEMPTFSVPSASAPGPAGAFDLTFLVVESPVVNHAAATGTLQSAEEVAMILLDLGHRFFVRDTAEFSAARQAMEPAEADPGHVAYRVRLSFLHTPTPSARVATPDIAEAGGVVTLTCATADADIYLTTDDSFPGPGNPVAALYAGPVPVEWGTILRVAAYKDGLAGSDVDRVVITE